jgi:hypothetical protein
MVAYFTLYFIIIIILLINTEETKVRQKSTNNVRSCVTFIKWFTTDLIIIINKLLASLL